MTLAFGGDLLPRLQAMNLKKDRGGLALWAPFLMIVVLSVVWLVSSKNSSNSRWNYFSSAEGMFSIEFPGTPEKKAVRGRINDSRFQDATFFVAETVGVAYMAGYSDEFEDVLRQFSADQLLDAARDGAIANAQGQFLYELSVTKDGFPGRDIHFLARGVKSRLQIFLVGRRKYIIGGVNLSANNAKNTERFLNSFQLSRRF